MTRTGVSLVVAVICVAAAATLWWRHSGASSPESQVRARIAEYDRNVQAMDSDAISRFFTEDGEMWNNGALVKRGPDAIRAYLHSFDGQVRVESQKTTIDHVVTTTDRVTVFATYQQGARVLKANSVVHVTGEIQSIWVPCEESSWCIKRVETTPR